METTLIRVYKALLVTILAGAVLATVVFLVTGLNRAYAMPDVWAGATQGAAGVVLPAAAGLIGVVLLIGHLLVVAAIKTDLSRQRHSLDRLETLLVRQMRRRD